MKVTYLGDKEHMFLNGYDFSENKTIDVPDSDKFAINKFKGNMYFHCDCDDNFEAPEFYVYEIKTLNPGSEDGKRKALRRIENVRVFGCQTEKEAKDFIKMKFGKVGESHIIKKSEEKIKSCSGLYTKKKK